ncbi:MAG: hypothetical protein Q7J85_10975 [Bacillota bacterium]|nr:hypothetical protein [Bacillota bacterium]
MIGVAVEEKIKQIALQRGADVAGIASVKDINKSAPRGHRPGDLLAGAKSVITIGARRYTAGTWMTSSTEVMHRSRSAMGTRDAIPLVLARYLEEKQGYPSIVYNAHMTDTGMNVSLSLKVLAEYAGLGSRSMAGGIILNKKFGLLGFSAVVTTMELTPDGLLSKPVCPHSSCIKMWNKKKTTPCMDACSAIEGTINGSRLQDVIYYRQLCATRALTTMNAAYLRLLSEIIKEEDPEKRKFLAIGQARQYAEDPPGRGIWGRCIECMRVCPVNRKAFKSFLKSREGAANE